MATEESGLTWFGYSVGLTILVAFVAFSIRSLRGGGDIPLAIHGLMALVAGNIFGKEIVSKVRK